MKVSHGWRILQIVAAQDGWKAVYCQESQNQEIKTSHRPIICWALVEALGATDGLRTEVRGVVQESSRLVIVGDLMTTDEVGEKDRIEQEYFLGYNDPEAHKESDYWMKQASIRIKTNNRQQ
jgi:hypothetical protein